MNLAAFYSVVRKTFTLTNQNVAGFDFLLNEAERRKTPINDLAYILATTWLETAATMQPIKEYGGTSYFFKMYDPYGSRPKVAAALGNVAAGDGAKYCGRGYVMITGRSNYQKAANKFGVDFVRYPDLVMDKKYALPILFTGMEEGWFTGKKLRDYIDKIDEIDAEDRREYEGARRIINGTDKALTIANHAIIFEKALKAGLYGLSIPSTKSTVIAPQGPSLVVVDDPGVLPSEKPQPSVWASLGSFFSNMFGGSNA